MCLSLAARSFAQDGGSLLVAEPGSSNLWKAEGPVAKPARYSDKFTHRRVESCVAVGMIIESDGSTSAHRVLKVSMHPKAREDDAELRALVEQWGLSMAKTYRCTPGPDNPNAEPAYTANVFVAARGKAPPERHDECKVDDLRATLAQSDTPTPAR